MPERGWCDTRTSAQAGLVSRVVPRCVFLRAWDGNELAVLGAQEMREAHGGFEVVIEDVGISPDFDCFQPGSGIGAEVGPLIGRVMREPEDAGGGGEEAVEVDEGG